MLLIKESDLLHAAAAIAASVVQNMFPHAQILRVHKTQLGFGVDFTLDTLFDETSLKLVDERMHLILKQNQNIESIQMMRENARELFNYHKQHGLADFVRSFPANIVSLIKIGNTFFPGALSKSINPKILGESKLIRFSKTENNGISLEGILCKDSRDLKAFLRKYREAKKYDSRILGPQLGLFLETAGSWIWLPQGVRVKEALLAKWQRLLEEAGYQRISILDKNLSDSYKQIKTIYESGYSLPMRLADSDIVYCLCEESQLEKELIYSLQLIAKYINIFAVDYQWRLVLSDNRSRDPKAALLIRALETLNLSYAVERNESEGRNARLEICLIDSLERESRCSGIEIIKGAKTPLLIKGSPFGSLERFVAALLEHYAGSLPLWLAPEQVKVIKVE